MRSRWEHQMPNTETVRWEASGHNSDKLIAVVIFQFFPLSLSFLYNYCVFKITILNAGPPF